MRPTAGVPVRPLAVLALVVIALHALALWMAPGAAPPTLRAAPWQWRTIEPQRPSAPATGDTAQPQPQAATPPAALRQQPAPAVSQRAAPSEPARSAADAVRPSQSASTTPQGSEPSATAEAATPLAGPIALPAPALWRYAVTAHYRGRLVTGEAQLAWRHDGHAYEAVLQVSAPPLPLRIQRSTGTIGPEGLEPLRFSERLRGERAAHFDRERGRIVFSGNDPDVALQPGAQDRLGVLLQLAARVAADPARFAPGTTVVLQVATAREAADWRFRVAGLEPLALPAGPVTALKLVRAPRHEWDPWIEAWLVPGGDYGPARLRLTAPNGDWLDLQKSGTDKG
ncbi:DUF3108 domain-containing protein [Ramlibacter sp.]|uniref:DUF3108 domain-containing protein n=1 Tax=Ramlibacter sp. TaxID=1917967 RepID=UPI002D426196|nr:DUF3108 domain-containing protein [Ramlibacter sp.]HYD77366.1 DUF3108 domain-containing protein [Ramlibacter sp.]